MEKGLEEALRENKGVDAIISINHQLYGKQKIKCQLDYIFDDNRIGFRAKDGQDIFVYRQNLKDYGIKDGIFFADDLMKIEIRLQAQ